MKKLFWVDLRGAYEKKLLTAALEAGTDALLLDTGKREEVQKMGKISVIAKDGDQVLGKDVDIVRITKKTDEDLVTKYQGKIPVIIENGDWTIIPLENLISKTTNLIQSVASPEEAKLALEIMERGADGVCLKPKNASDILETGRIVEELSSPALTLETVIITETSAVAMSDRCTVDTTSLLPEGTGLLVGNSSNALFLVHNENVQSPYCAARPFRVNAGAVHAYVKLPENKTKYLCELQSGDPVLVVDTNGKTRVVAVGRNKIERRPMMRITAERKDGEKLTVILQNAETIRLVSPQGKPLSVTMLQKGDEVLAFFGDGMGRHFGEPIKESIQEK